MFSGILFGLETYIYYTRLAGQGYPQELLTIYSQ